MKVLMLGWEYPPNITGGLGTACHGIVESMCANRNIEVDLFLPEYHDICQTKRLKIHSIKRLSALHRPGPHVECVDCELNTAFYREFLGPFLASLPSRRHADLVYSWIYPTHTFTAPPTYDHSREQTSAYSCDSSIAFRNLVSASAIARIAENFDVIHAHDWMTFVLGIKLKLLTGKPVVLHVHSTEFDRSNTFGDAIISSIERFALGYADRVIAVSANTSQLLVERYGADPRSLITVHNGVKLGEMSPLQRAPGTPVVTFIGRVTAQKNPLQFIRAAHSVVQSMRDVKFVLAGSGDLVEEAKRLVSELGISEFFDFPGFLSPSEVSALLCRSSVYVMPSISEPFGIGALEAVSCGVPVIVSKNAGVAEVIDSLIKVDADDVEGIAAAILELIGSPQHAMEIAGRAMVEASVLTWDRAVFQILSSYQNLHVIRESASCDFGVN